MHDFLQTLFNSLEWERADDHSQLITEVADSYMSLEKYDAALKYYQMVDGTAEESVRNYVLFSFWTSFC